MALYMGIGFDNPEYSDAKVALTTESAESFRARTASTARKATLKRAKRSSGVDAPSCAPAGEEVQVTKLVLCSQSDYFKAAFEWQRNSSGRGAGSKRPRDETPVVVMSLADEALFPTARALLLFLYTHTLEAGMDRTQLLQLIQLADEYAVVELRRACLQQLNQVPLDGLAPAELKLLYEVAAIVATDCHSGGELGAAASSMVSRLAALFAKLEEAWRSSDQREAFCSLPYAIVRQILGSPDLVVKSENTVLVAALSWLRSEQGKHATADERKEVLLQVRLLQLSPWFMAAVVHFPESQELLLPRVFSKLVRHLASPEAARIEYQGKDELLQAWAKPRGSGAAAGSMTRDLEFSLGQQEVVAAVLKCREDMQTATVYTSESSYFDGFFWDVGVEYSCVADKTVIEGFARSAR